MDRVKVIQVGHGHLGKWHLQKALSSELCEVLAVVESSQKAREKLQVEYPDLNIVKSMDEAIKLGCDAYLVVTPTSSHFELVKMALEQGQHVFCEKPLTETYQQAIELGAFVGSSIVQVGHSERCHQIWEKLRPELLASTGPFQFKIERVAPFKGRATDVDVVTDLMIHDIDLVHYLLGKRVTSVLATGHKLRTDKNDHVQVVVELEDGSRGTLISSRNHVKEVRSLEIVSPEGMHFVDLSALEYSFAPKGQFSDGSFVKSEPYQKRDHLAVEQESFYQSILNGAAPMVTYSDGVGAIQVLSAVMQSLTEGRRVEL